MELSTGMPADAPTAAVETTTPADPQRIWRVITDPAHPVQWSPELEAAEWIDDGPALGAHFRGHHRRGDRSWSTTCTVTSYDEGRRFAWTVAALHDPVSSWTYELETSEAGTRITFTCRLGPGRWDVSAAHPGGPDRDAQGTEQRLDELRSAMEETLQGVVATVAAKG